MALANIGKKAGCLSRVTSEFGPLDPGDKAYIDYLMQQKDIKGNRIVSDDEVISRLEQRISREQDDAVELFEDNNIPVARAGSVSEGSFSETSGQSRPEGQAKPEGEEKVTEETDAAVSQASTETNVSVPQRTEDEASPSPGGRTDTLGFGTVPVEGDQQGKSKPRRSGALKSQTPTLTNARIKEAKPTEWTENNGRHNAGAYSIHKTVDEGVDSRPWVVNHSDPFLSIGFYPSLEAAKAGAKKHWDNTYSLGTDLGFGPFAELIGESDRPLLINAANVDAVTTKLRESSPLLNRFLKNHGKLLVDAAKNSYNAQTDTVKITGLSTGNNTDINTEEGLKHMVTVVEHEILHANTVAYMVKHLSERTDDSVVRDIKYLGKAVVELGSLDTSKLSKETAHRINYILDQNELEVSVAEFIAIMGAETDVSNEIYRALGRKQGLAKKTLSETIKRFVKRIARLLTDKDMAGPVDIDLLNGALLRTMQQGQAWREQSYGEHKQYSEVLSTFDYNDKAPEVAYRRKASMDYLNLAVSSMINSKLENQGKKILGNAHDMMYERFPIYQDVADKLRGVYDGSPHLQQFIHTVTGEGVNKLRKADVLSQFAKVNAQRTEIINDQISQMHALSKDMSDNDKQLLDTVISQMPLHDYFVLAGKLNTVDKIENRAEFLRKELWRQNARAVRDVDQLVDWNIEEKAGGSIYNLATKYPVYDPKNKNEFGVQLRELLALESIKRIGTKKFVKLLKHEDLMNVIKDNSVANRLSSITNEGLAPVRDSLVMDYYSEPHTKHAITFDQLASYEYEDTGWKILKRPTRTELGIVYRPTIDSTDIAGAYTDTKLVSTDIDVPETMKKFPGVVETKTGYKLRIPKELKREMGLNEDFSQGLVRSTAHSIAIQESQIIRDELLKEDAVKVVGGVRNTKEVVDIIEADNMDNPWFLKLQEGKTYDELPAAIKAKYMRVGKRASNVKGFNESVDLVRKDISHWLLGGKAKSLFTNPQMKWAVRTLKNLISGAKIGMVVLNPVKIANDNLSNLAYLGVLGVDPIFIAKNYQDIQTSFAEYSDLTRQIMQLKIQLVSRPESTKVKQKLKKLQKRLAQNSIGDIADKGFVNSLGSDLVSRSADTLSGFQADMHKALDYLLHDKAGNRNYVSHFIMQIQQLGFQAEDFFQYLGGIAGRSKSTALMGQELDQVAKRLREIKSEKDVVNYVAQFTTSPSSEAVRFGSAMTDLTDVLAKETLYRHLVEHLNMSPEKARIQVLDSFPDYKENMPIAVQQLSDTGIIMFPSFWLRIQKVVYRLLRDKPVGLATEVALQEMLQTDVGTFFDANIINKSQTFGGLFHFPFEPVGAGSVVPTHIF